MKESPSIYISSPESRTSDQSDPVLHTSLDIPRLSIDAATPPTAELRRSPSPPFITQITSVEDTVHMIATSTPRTRSRNSVSPHSPLVSPPPPPMPLQDVRVVVVDDMPVTSKITAAMLKKAGAIIVGQACTGSEAIALASKGGIDAILLDLHLPDMDGFDVAHRIRAAEAARWTGGFLTPTAPISTASRNSLQAPLSPALNHIAPPDISPRIWLIALTGDSGLKQECIDAGIDAYLVKPARQEQLIHALRQSFARGRSPSPERPNVAFMTIR